MVMARLHVICGNCGSNDFFTFKIDPHGDVSADPIPEFKPAVYIYCGNCATLHDLSDTIKEEPEKLTGGASGNTNS